MFLKSLGQFLLANFLYIFLILGTTFVYLSKQLNPRKKQLLIFAKLLLFCIFLLINYYYHLDNNRFIQVQQEYDSLDFLTENPFFKFELEDQKSQTISLQDHIKDKKGGLKIYYNPNLDEIKFLIHALVLQQSAPIQNLKYVNQKENWDKYHAHIMQSIKKDIIGLIGKKEKIIIFENLSKELLEHEFLELLIMMENNLSNCKFIILENKAENIQFIKKHLGFLNYFEIKEIDPEMFKNLIIHLIMNSPGNKLLDVQAAKIADDYYKQNGAKLKDLMKLYHQYYPHKK